MQQANPQVQESSNTPVELNSLQGTTEQLVTLSSRAQELGGYAQDVLDGAVQVDTENEQSIQQQAINYGQYLYCKQVVDTFEAEN